MLNAAFGGLHRHHLRLRKLLHLHSPFIVNLSSKCLVYELLSGIDLVQVPFCLGELGVQIELHQLFKALVPILGK